MVKRSEPKSKADDRHFPIRLKFVMPPAGLRENGWRLENWLRDELGDHDHAVHVLGAGLSIYLRQLTAAQRFVDAFPHLVLADGVAEEYGIRKPRRPIFETWHSAGRGSR